MRWPRSPGEEERIRPAAAQRGQEAQLGDADVLRLVHDGEVERRLLRPPAMDAASS